MKIGRILKDMMGERINKKLNVMIKKRKEWGNREWG